jgi:branched-chain amino acid transport system ATP-binding protein
LAPVIVKTLGRLIEQLKEKGFTIILVEQNFRFAAPLADRHYVIEHGGIAEMIARDELSSSMERLNRYLGV